MQLTKMREYLGSIRKGAIIGSITEHLTKVSNKRYANNNCLLFILIYVEVSQFRKVLVRHNISVGDSVVKV